MTGWKVQTDFRYSIDLSLAKSEPEPPLMVERVEYWQGRDRHAEKTGLFYAEVIERASDHFTCLSLRSASSKRAHNIEVGEVYALTVAGKRIILQTPSERFRIRAQEIQFLLSGKIEDWARPYFDPSSQKYYARQPGYLSQVDEDFENRRERRLTAPSAIAPSEPQGCSAVLVMGVCVVGGLSWLVGLI